MDPGWEERSMMRLTFVLRMKIAVPSVAFYPVPNPDRPTTGDRAMVRMKTVVPSVAVWHCVPIKMRTLKRLRQEFE